MKSFQVSGRTGRILFLVGVLIVAAATAVLLAKYLESTASAADHGRLREVQGPYVSKDVPGIDVCNPLSGLPDGGSPVCPTRLLTVHNPLLKRVIFSFDCDGLEVRDLYELKARETKTFELRSDEAGDAILSGKCWVKGFKKV